MKTASVEIAYVADCIPPIEIYEAVLPLAAFIFVEECRLWDVAQLVKGSIHVPFVKEENARYIADFWERYKVKND